MLLVVFLSGNYHLALVFRRYIFGRNKKKIIKMNYKIKIKNIEVYPQTLIALLKDQGTDI